MQSIRKKYKQVTATRKGKVISLSILLVIMVAIGGAVFYWNIYRKQIIRVKLQDSVWDKTNGLYALHYDSLKLDEVEGNLSVANLTLKYDSTKYIALLEKNEAPPTLLKINIPSITVTGEKHPVLYWIKKLWGKNCLL